MKLSRSYLLGLGSGLILSALIAMVLPNGKIKLSEGSTSAIKQESTQATTQGLNAQEPFPQKNSDQESSAENSKLEKSSPVDSLSQKASSKDSQNDPSEESASKASNDEKPSVSTFTIPDGVSAEKIADLLIQEHWITDKEEFLDLVKQKNLANKFKAGSFELTQGMSLEEIIDRLIQ